MTGLPLGLLVEGAVAVLLVLTIGYCVVLNERLKKLHADRETMRGMVRDLMRATELANSAISHLKDTAAEAEQTLNARLDEAERFAVQLANHVTAGQTVLERIGKITSAARHSETIARVDPGRGQVALQQLAVHQQRKGNAA